MLFRRKDGSEIKVAIVSALDIIELKQKLKDRSIPIDSKRPEVVICYGGDGTILYAERKYPGVPKLPIKVTNVCRMCDHDKSELDQVLDKLKQEKFTLKESMKLETEYNGRLITALNEIQIRNRLPIRAVRFNVQVGEKDYDNLIGDGVLVATPFGSSGYYQAIGGKEFKKGIGVAFNNIHSHDVKGVVVPETTEIKIEINREDAYLAWDNSESLIQLNKGDKITIRKSKDVAKFVII